MNAAVVQQSFARTQFAREHFDTVIDEIELLVDAHYGEVNHHPDIPPGIDKAKYQTAEKIGILRVYTVRVDDLLVGYEVFMVGFSMHYCTSFQARMDTLFIHPAYRKGIMGFRFLRWVQQQLEAEGVEVGYRHHKILEGGRLDLAPIFKRLGWEPIYVMYFRRFKALRHA